MKTKNYKEQRNGIVKVLARLEATFLARAAGQFLTHEAYLMQAAKSVFLAERNAARVCGYRGRAQTKLTLAALYPKSRGARLLELHIRKNGVVSYYRQTHITKQEANRRANKARNSTTERVICFER
jgi:hypothetical protein